MTSFLIGDRVVGPEAPPLVIAEMSGNHNQSLDRALELVDAAAASGAHALKLQTYKPETITLKRRGGDFDIHDENSLWSGQNLHDLYTKAQTPWEWHRPIMERAAEKGMLCFSSPFDESAVDFLNELNVPAFKIASFENNHLPLIRKAASTGKPLIISTGMASLADLERAVSAARDAGCKDLVLLKCTSTYPAPIKDTNLKSVSQTLKDYKEKKNNQRDNKQIRNYGIGAQIIKDLKIKKMILITKSPKKVIGLDGYGIKIIKQELI